jgi:hypothetical protein
VLPARPPDTCVQSTTITLPGALADIIPAIIQNEPATSGQSVCSFVLHRQLILSLPSTKAAFNSHSSRVRRKRQRLPSSLLIENVSAVSFTASPQHFRAETFPIKASDNAAKWIGKHSGLSGNARFFLPMLRFKVELGQYRALTILARKGR